MAKIYGHNEAVDFAAKNLITFGGSFTRSNGQPLDKSSVWYPKDGVSGYDRACEYAASAAAYVGQELAVIDVTYAEDRETVIGTSVKFYGIQDTAGTLKELGAKPVGDNASIIVDAAGLVSVFGFAGAQDGMLPVREGGKLTWKTLEAIGAGDGNDNTTYQFAANEAGNGFVVTPLFNGQPIKEGETQVKYEVSLNVYTKAEADAKFLAKADYVPYDETPLANRVKAVEDAVNDENTGLASHEERIQAMETFWSSTEDSDGIVNKLKEIQEYIASDETGAAAMAGDIQKNKEDIAKVDGKIAAAIAPLAKSEDVTNGLAGKVDKDGYIAFTQAEKDKLAGLSNYNDSAISDRVAAVEANFTEGKANDAVKFGGQAPEYYATAQSVSDAIAGVHTHSNRDVLEGITAGKVAAWDKAEENAKSFAETGIATAKEEVERKITAEAERAEGIEAGFETRIKALEDKEPTKVEKSDNNGNIKVDGKEVKVYDDSAIAARVKNVEDNAATKSELTTGLGGKVDKTTLDNYYTKGETETKITEMIADVNANVGESAAGVLAQLNAHKTAADGKFAEVNTAIKANADAIAVLNGEGTGSVKKQVADGIASIVASAPSDFDTLKEIADYIANDKLGATELTNKVNANATAIAVLNGTGEGSVSKKISDAIAGIPAATASALGLVKIGETMSVTADGTINVAKVSTDILVQGENELVLMGGSAK
jgi:uncharacterized protein YqgV (UPF0045/DUF77 family)